MLKKKCSLCGGDLVNNRCTFCGLDNSIYDRERSIRRSISSQSESPPDRDLDYQRQASRGNQRTAPRPEPKTTSQKRKLYIRRGRQHTALQPALWHPAEEGAAWRYGSSLLQSFSLLHCLHSPISSATSWATVFPL